MIDYKTGTREEWLAARLELLEDEKELTRRSDEVARRRQELPWVRIDKDYRFETVEAEPSELATNDIAHIGCGNTDVLRCHSLLPAALRDNLFDRAREQGLLSGSVDIVFGPKHGSGRHRMDAHVGAELERQRPRHHDQRGLGHAVDRVAA